jgi:hypothetical protein
VTLHALLPPLVHPVHERDEFEPNELLAVIAALKVHRGAVATGSHLITDVDLDVLLLFDVHNAGDIFIDFFLLLFAFRSIVARVLPRGAFLK